MKTNSLLVLLIFLFPAQIFAAVQDAPALASEGIFATFDAGHAKKTEILSEKFAFMTKDMAAKFGISNLEMESYNRELDQLNAMMIEISHDLEEMKKPTVEDAVSLWSGLKGAVSASTLAAIKKITKGK
ncbi:MAG: hypothetical protein V4598_06600 [Bdellovibrionota bacterium]